MLWYKILWYDTNYWHLGHQRKQKLLSAWFGSIELPMGSSSFKRCSNLSTFEPSSCGARGVHFLMEMCQGIWSWEKIALCNTCFGTQCFWTCHSDYKKQVKLHWTGRCHWFTACAGRDLLLEGELADHRITAGGDASAQHNAGKSQSTAAKAWGMRQF